MEEFSTDNEYMKKNIFKNIKISYNAPVTLTFTLISVVVYLIDYLLYHNLISSFFTACGNSFSSLPFNFNQPICYLRLISHIFGNASWTQLIGNLTFILLLGPAVEEKYGSLISSIMIFIASLVTGVLNSCITQTPMTGANEISFLLVLLSSFSTISKKQIPLSFIFVLLLYLGNEFNSYKVSDFIIILADLAGGLCGSLMAFLAIPKSRKPKTDKKTEQKSNDEKTAEENYYKQIRLNQKKRENNMNSDDTIVGSIDL